MGTAATHFAGIDVSKDTLDACLLLPGGKTKEATFANDPTGHAALLAWADRHADGAAVHFCLEATGPVLRGTRHPPGRRRPARQRGQPDPHQVRRTGPRPRQQDRQGRRQADRRLRRPRATRRPGSPRPRRSGSCRGWCGGSTTSSRWPPGRRAGSPPRADRRVRSRSAGPSGSWRRRPRSSGPRPTRWSPPPRRCRPTGSCWSRSPASAGRPRRPSWPSCRPSTGCRPPSRRPRTAGSRRGSSPAGRASGRRPGCRRPATPGCASRCSCRPRRRSGSTPSSRGSSTGSSRPASRRCRPSAPCMRKLVMIAYGVLKNRTAVRPELGLTNRPLDNTLPGSACLCRYGANP